MGKMYNLFGMLYLIKGDKVLGKSTGEPYRWIYLNLHATHIETIVNCGVLIAKNIKLKRA